MCTHCPTPCDKALIGSVVGATEDVFVIFHEGASTVLDDIKRCGTCLLQIVAVQFASHASSSEQHLGIETFSAVVVNTSRCALSFGKQFHRLFQSHQNVVVNIGFLHLIEAVVVTCCNVGRVVVHDRYIAKTTYQEEVGHCFPSKAFAHTLFFHALRGGRSLDGVIHSVGMTNFCPE